MIKSRREGGRGGRRPGQRVSASRTRARRRAKPLPGPAGRPPGPCAGTRALTASESRYRAQQSGQTRGGRRSVRRAGRTRPVSLPARPGGPATVPSAGRPARATAADPTGQPSLRTGYLTDRTPQHEPLACRYGTQDKPRNGRRPSNNHAWHQAPAPPGPTSPKPRPQSDQSRERSDLDGERGRGTHQSQAGHQPLRHTEPVQHRGSPSPPSAGALADSAAFWPLPSNPRTLPHPQNRGPHTPRGGHRSRDRESIKTVPSRRPPYALGDQPQPRGPSSSGHGATSGSHPGLHRWLGGQRSALRTTIAARRDSLVDSPLARASASILRT